MVNMKLLAVVIPPYIYHYEPLYKLIPKKYKYTHRIDICYVSNTYVTPFIDFKYIPVGVEQHLW